MKIKAKALIFVFLPKKVKYYFFVFVKNLFFGLHFKTGCGAVRLAYTAGGRVVAGSNPVIPTNKNLNCFMSNC